MLEQFSQAGQLLLEHKMLTREKARCQLAMTFIVMCSYIVLKSWRRWLVRADVSSWEDAERNPAIVFSGYRSALTSRLRSPLHIDNSS